MRLEQLVEQFKDEVGLDKPFPTGEKGSYLVPMDDTHTVEIFDLNPGIGFYCRITECPTQDRETFFTQMLLANLFGQGTERAILGLDAEEKHIVLRKEFTYDIGYKRFTEEIEDFMNAIDLWTNEATQQQAA